MNKKIMEKMGFGEEVKLVEQGICPLCKVKVKMEDLKDEISVREFKISGLCFKCQGDFFDKPK